MISGAAITRVASREAERFRAANPRAFSHHAAAIGFFQSVPFHWMKDWPSPVPIVAASAKNATLTSIDGQAYDDFCLGDTASLFGHSPPALAAALAKQASEGLSYMLPTERGAAFSARLAAMFCLPLWQVTTTASEANRAVIRWCRGISGRAKILTFNGAYHGAVDDAFVDLKNGQPVMRASLVGQVHDLRATTTAIEFNDEAALAEALRAGDIACVLAEPVMTNVGMVRDAPGFLQSLRRLCDETGTLLVFDETHTISSGYGGHGVTHGPKPDLMVVGKSIGGGVPCAVYGFSSEVAAQMSALNQSRPAMIICSAAPRALLPGWSRKSRTPIWIGTSPTSAPAWNSSPAPPRRAMAAKQRRRCSPTSKPQSTCSLPTAGFCWRLSTI